MQVIRRSNCIYYDFLGHFQEGLGWLVKAKVGIPIVNKWAPTVRHRTTDVHFHIRDAKKYMECECHWIREAQSGICGSGEYYQLLLLKFA